MNLEGLHERDPRVIAEVLRYCEAAGNASRTARRLRRICAGLGVSVAGSAGGDPARIYDPRLLPGSANLFACQSLRYSPCTLSPAPLASGTTTPTCSFSSVLTGRSISVQTPIGGALGTATWRASFDDMGTWPLSGTTPAAPGPVDLGGGTFFNFGAGTYTGGNNAATSLYRSKISNWGSVGVASGCGWDDSSVVASSGPVFNAWGMNNRGPAATFNGSMLGNQDNYHAPVNGLPKRWTMIERFQCVQMPATTAALRTWSYSSTTQTTRDFLQSYATGTTLSPPSIWALTRSDDAAAIITTNSIFKIDNSWHVREWVCDSSRVKIYIDGMPIWDDVANPTGVAFAGGTIVLNRWTVGGQKLAGSAATNFLRMSIDERWVYDTDLPLNTRAVLRAALA